MIKQVYEYVIVGGGLAGASAIDGIRELDKVGKILMICAEKHLPYDRPPLSKKLWLGKQKVESIFLHGQTFYDQHKVTLLQGVKAERLDPSQRTITTSNGESYGFGKLLLATGCMARRLTIPGSNLEGICYFRSLSDYLHTRSVAAAGKSAVVVGGGFIGSELAAALSINKLNVTMIFPDATLCSRVFPDSLARAMLRNFQERGINVLTSDKPDSFSRNGDKFITHTESGKTIESDLVIVGVGVTPETDLAKSGSLQVGNGIVVNEYLETSDPAIYAAGDNALFPHHALGQQMRLEHWDNSLSQGKWAGRNMAGAHKSFTYQPYFFSDLFEFGYEATGEVDSRLDTFADWQKENDTGVIYYLRNGKVRGVMLCNVWDKIEAARALIKNGETVVPEMLRDLIR